MSPAAIGPYVNLSAAEVAEVPPPVVTVMSTVPAGLAGDTTVIDVSLLTVKVVAASVPKSTAAAPVRPVPVTVTVVPAGPEDGLTELTVGAAM